MATREVTSEPDRPDRHAQYPADDGALTLEQLPDLSAAGPAHDQAVPAVARQLVCLPGLDIEDFDAAAIIELPAPDRRESWLVELAAHARAELGG